MTYILLALLIFGVYNVWKKPMYGAIITLFVFSFGALFIHYNFSLARYGAVVAIFIIEIFKGKSYLNKTFFALLSFFIFKELLNLINNGSFHQFSMSAYYYIITPTIAYLSFCKIKENNGDFLRQLKVYFIICLLVQLYRTIFDITFFGIIEFNFDINKYEDSMVVGSDLFRPSNLESCITFSIELGTFLGLLLLREKLSKWNILILLFGMIGLVLTLSRSGLVIFAIAVAYYAYANKNYKFLALIFIFGGFLAVNMGFMERLTEMTDFGSETYQTRGSSIQNVTDSIRNFDFLSYIIGLGFGSANYAAEAGDSFKFYVENYYLATFINGGLIYFIALLLFCLLIIVHGWNKKKDYLCLSVGIMITNCLSCNLLSYTVEILFIYLAFSILHRERYKTVCVK